MDRLCLRGFWSLLKVQILAQISSHHRWESTQPRCCSLHWNVDACFLAGVDYTQGRQGGRTQWIKGPNTRSWWARDGGAGRSLCRPLERLTVGGRHSQEAMGKMLKATERARRWMRIKQSDPSGTGTSWSFIHLDGVVWTRGCVGYVYGKYS